MVSDLVHNLSRIKYPLNKLDIIFVTEADDQETNLAVENRLCRPFRHFKTPPSQPRTKPKALNAAYNSIPESQRGDIITVYDAEDRPHPNQLRAAANAFQSDPALVAVQAPLSYYNACQNWLTRQFDIEYAALFQVWNPALARLGLVFTLGGTSNHIKREALEAAGGWDAYNVTEDADLSFRLAALDWTADDGSKIRSTIDTIPFGTDEEAVADLPAWINQRSRWLKGFMQTASVHMRLQKNAPNREIPIPRGEKLRTIASLFATITPTLLMAFLHLPSLLILASLWLMQNPSGYGLTLMIGTVIIGYGSSVLMGFTGCLKANKPSHIPWCALMPLYWGLQIVPAIIAGWEYVYAPYAWTKTDHKGANTHSYGHKPSPPLAAE